MGQNTGTDRVTHVAERQSNRAIYWLCALLFSQCLTAMMTEVTLLLLFILPSGTDLENISWISRF